MRQHEIQRVLPSAGGWAVRCQARSSCTGAELYLAAGSVPAEHRETAWIIITPATVMPTTTNGDDILSLTHLLRQQQKWKKNKHIAVNLTLQS